jgi:hypothetical protein
MFRLFDSIFKRLDYTFFIDLEGRVDYFVALASRFRKTNFLERIIREASHPTSRQESHESQPKDISQAKLLVREHLTAYRARASGS